MLFRKLISSWIGILFLNELWQHLHRAQQQMKAQADGKRDISFQEGDLVFLMLRPYRQKTLASHMNEKLSPRFYSPFKIIEKIGPVAYCLQLLDSPNSSSFLSPALSALWVHFSPLPDLPPQLNEALQLLVEPEAVLGVRPSSSPIHIHHGQEVLIKWKGLSDYEASWELSNVIKQLFPAFHLEDKVHLQSWGNDRSPVQFTYVRRKRKGPPKERVGST